MNTSEIVQKVITRINDSKNTGSSDLVVRIDPVLVLEFHRTEIKIIVSNTLVTSIGMDTETFLEIKNALKTKRELEKQNALNLL